MKDSKKQQITYTYWRWNEESKKTLPMTITSGQNGVTEEHIIMLNESEHTAGLGDRYEQEKLNYGTPQKSIISRLI